MNSEKGCAVWFSIVPNDWIFLKFRCEVIGKVGGLCRIQQSERGAQVRKRLVADMPMNAPCLSNHH